MDSGRQSVAEAAGKFGYVGESLSSPSSGPSFGSMPASQRVGQLTTQLGSSAASQYSAAQAFLSGVQASLAQVRQNYADAEETNARNARSV